MNESREPSLYAKVLGEHFAQLPMSVRRFHALQRMHALTGYVEIEAAPTVSGRLLARLLGAPTRNARGQIRFTLDAGSQREVWVRHFPGSTMRSVLTLHDGMLCERLGITTLHFRLDADEDGLEMRLIDMRVLGIPCPWFLLPSVFAQESEVNGRFHFEVRTAMPLVGRVLAYKGHLELPD